MARLRVTSTVFVLLLGVGACRRGEESSGRAGSGSAAAGATTAGVAADAQHTALPTNARETLTGGARPGDTLPLPLVVLLGDGGSSEGLAEVARDLPVPARLIALPPSSGTEPDLGRQADELGRLAERLVAVRGSRGKPILVGAGRGGTVALGYAARAPRSLGAVIVVGAELPTSVLPSGPPPDVGSTPLRVYVHHGSLDEITPVARGGAASDELALRGLAAVLHLDPRAGHALSPHLVAEMRARLIEEIHDAK